MQLEILKNTVISCDGRPRNVSAGQSVEVDNQQAAYLISIGKARQVVADQVAKPAARRRKKAVK